MNDPTKKPVSIPQQVDALMRKNSARAEASGKMLTDLKSIAVAMVNYNEAKRSFPPAAIAGTEGQPLLSWRVKLLPFLSQEDLYKQFHLDEPWDSEHNLPLVKQMPDCYASPGADKSAGKTVFLVPTGKETIFSGTEGTPARQISDGLDGTILIVVADAEHAVPWTRPEDLEIDPKHPAAGLAEEQGFLTIAWADGRVVRLKAKDPSLWRAFTRAAGDGTGTRLEMEVAPPPQK